MQHGNELQIRKQVSLGQGIPTETCTLMPQGVLIHQQQSM